MRRSVLTLVFVVVASITSRAHFVFVVPAPGNATASGLAEPPWPDPPTERLLSRSQPLAIELRTHAGWHEAVIESGDDVPREGQLSEMQQP